MRKTGGRWVGHCPAPEHRDETPSFTVYPETNSWFCFGACGMGGDVVDLAAAVWGYEDGETAMAAANLLHEFGYEIPDRRDSWHRKESEKVRVQDGLRDALAASYRRRWFRVITPVLDGADKNEAREVWCSLWLLARERAERRMAERGLL